MGNGKDMTPNFLCHRGRVWRGYLRVHLQMMFFVVFGRNWRTLLSCFFDTPFACELFSGRQGAEWSYLRISGCLPGLYRTLIIFYTRLPSNMPPYLEH